MTWKAGEMYDRVNTGRYNNPVVIPERAADGENDEEVRSARALYHDVQRQRTDQFRYELLDWYKLTAHPKAGLAFQIAWDRGHAAGLHEVVAEFDSLVELLLP